MWAPRNRSAVAARGIAALVLATITLVASPGNAFAHADLTDSEPAAGSVLAESPGTLALRFSEDVDSVPGGIRVVAADGTEVVIGDPGRESGSNATLVVDLPDLAEGTYVVAWRAISADSHPVSGAFTFSVGVATETDPGLVEGLLTGDRQLTGAAQLMAAGRWASFAGAAVVVGLIGTAFLIVSAVPSRRLRQLVVAAGVIGVIGTVVMLATQSALAVNRWGGVTDGEAWRATLGSRAGRWWVIRGAALAVLAPLGVALTTGSGRRRTRSLVFMAASVAVLTVVAAGGHAISGRAIALGFAATVVHLLAMAIWIGGLLSIALAAGGDRMAVARKVSPVALAAVVALVASGLINVWRQVGTLNGLTDTSYGRWLLVKTVVVVVVMAIAGVSRWELHQQRSSSDAEAVDGSTVVPIRRLVVAELGMLVLALAATSFLVSSPPPIASASAPASISIVNGERIAQVTVDRATTGGTPLHVYITSAGLLDAPDEIVVQVSLPEREIGPIVLDTIAAGPGHVIATRADFPLPGNWTVELRVRYGEFELVTFVGQLEIK